jgi:hypothetical protein
MRIDLYTRMMLTIIAACLVWLSFGVPSLATPMQAQGVTHVVISGWMDEKGITHSLSSCCGQSSLPVWVSNR